MASETALPRLREDLEIIRAEGALDGGSGDYVIRDPVTQRSFALDVAAARVLAFWSGARTREELERQVIAQSPETTHEELDALLGFVIANRLADVRDLPPLPPQPRPGGFLGVFIVRRHVFNPRPLVRALGTLVDRLPAGQLRLVHLLLLAAGLMLLAPRIEDLQHLFQFSAANVAAVGVAIVVGKMAHEIAHAYVATRAGAVVTSIGVMWYGLMPIPYADVADIWRIRERRQKIAVSLAGMRAETMLALYALVMWQGLPPGFAADVLGYLFTVNLVGTVLYNGNPLGRADGYYVLADMIGSADLKVESSTAVLKLARTMAQRRRPRLTWREAGLMVYALSSLGYRIAVVVAIAWLLDQVITWGPLTVVAYLVAATLIAVRPTWLEFRIANRQLASADGPNATPPRLWPHRLVWAGIGLVPLLIPIPAGFTAPALIGRAEEARVFARGFGEVTGAVPMDRDVVRAGDMLLLLSDPETNVKLAAENAALALVDRSIANDVVLGNSSGALERHQIADSIRGRIAALQDRQLSLAHAAARSGTFRRAHPALLVDRYSEGAPVGLVLAGQAEVVMLLKPEQAAQLRPGQSFDFTDRAGTQHLTGKVAWINASISEANPYPELHDAYRGRVPSGGAGLTTGFVVVRGALDVPPPALPLRLSGTVRITAPAQPLGARLVKAVSDWVFRIYTLLV